MTSDAAGDAAPVPNPSTGRLYLWLGLFAGLLGPVLSLVQLFWLKRLITPWYWLALGSCSVLLLLLAVVQARSLGRIVALVVFVLLVGIEAFALFSFTVLPPYAGPASAGQPFPAFRTTLATGASFTQDDLKGAQATVLVFFRGRW